MIAPTDELTRDPFIFKEKRRSSVFHANAGIVSEQEYLAARAYDSYRTTLRVFAALSAFSIVISTVTWVAMDVGWAIVTTATSLCLVVATTVIRNTKFGKKHVESFSAVTATLLQLSLAVGASGDYSMVAASLQRCKTSNLTVSAGGGGGVLFNSTATSGGGGDLLQGFTGDYCLDLLDVAGYGGRVLNYQSNFAAWLLFTLIVVLLFRLPFRHAAVVTIVPGVVQLGFGIHFIVVTCSLDFGTILFSVLSTYVPGFAVVLWAPHIAEQLHRANFAHAKAQEAKLRKQSSTILQLRIEMDRAQQVVDKVMRKCNTALDAYKIPHSSLEFMEELGQGAFGTVYRGLLRFKSKTQTVAEVAVKTVRATKVTETTIEDFMQELLIMTPLRHPNLVVVHGGCWSDGPDKLCLVLEFCSGGTLSQLLNTLGNNWSDPFHRIALSVAKCFRYLHHEQNDGKPLIHRDLKPDNVLFAANGVAKIADFGEAKKLDLEEADEDGQLTLTLVGTPMAPEIMSSKKYNEKVDVYSFAIVLLEMASSSNHRDVRDQFMQVGRFGAASGWRPEFSTPTMKGGVEVSRLIKSCWASQPSARPSFGAQANDQPSIVQQLETLRPTKRSIAMAKRQRLADADNLAWRAALGLEGKARLRAWDESVRKSDLAIHDDTDTAAWTLMKKSSDGVLAEWRKLAGSPFRLYRFSQILENVSAKDAYTALVDSIGTADSVTFGDKSVLHHELVAKLDSKHLVIWQTSKMPRGLSDRIFYNLAFKDDDNLMLVGRDAATMTNASKELARRSLPDVAGGMVLGGFLHYGLRFTETKDGCRVSGIECVDPKGGVPHILVNLDRIGVARSKGLRGMYKSILKAASRAKPGEDVGPGAATTPTATAERTVNPTESELPEEEEKEEREDANDDAVFEEVDPRQAKDELIARLKRENARLRAKALNEEVRGLQLTQGQPSTTSALVPLETIRMRATERHARRRKKHAGPAGANTETVVLAQAPKGVLEQQTLARSTGVFSDLLQTFRASTEAGPSLTLVEAAPTTTKSLEEILAGGDFDAIGAVFFPMLKELKSSELTEDFVEAFLSANFPKGSDHLVPVLRPLLLKIASDARVSLKMAKQGAGIRLLIGVVLTYSDLVSDVLVAYDFWVQGKSGMFGFVAAFLVVPLVIQAAFASFVFGQGWKDALLCLCGVKPIVDSWRVWNGTPEVEGQHVKNAAILTLTKLIEVCFECFPQTLILASGVLSSPLSEFTLLQRFSLASSFLSAGFILASGMLDSDQDPHNRKGAPNLHGFVPNSLGRKAAVLSSSLTFFMCYQAGAVLALASFWVGVGALAAVGVFGGLALLFLLTQYLRGEWYFYTVPQVKKHRTHCGEPTAFAQRLLWSSMYVCSSPWRAPQCQFCVSQDGSTHTHVWATALTTTTLIVNWALLILGTNSASCTGDLMVGGPVICSHREELLFCLAASTTGVVLCSAVFLSTIERKFVGTFYKPDSYASYVKRHWGKYSTKDMITSITLRNPGYWPMEEVRAFIAEHWEEWTAEKPAWFADPRWKANLPPYYLPPAAQ